MRLPWQVVKWRCSAFTPILPPGAAVPAWLHSSLSVTLSPPVSGSRGRVISKNGWGGRALVLYRGTHRVRSCRYLKANRGR